MMRERGSLSPREKKGVLPFLGAPPVLFCALATGLLLYTFTKHIYTGKHNHACSDINTLPYRENVCALKSEPSDTT